MNKITAVILAAGQGKRMNTPVAKQFLLLRDKPVLYYSLEAFQESCVNNIILVVGNDQVDYCREHIIEPYGFGKVSKIIEGGRERYDSVYNALINTENSDYVLIHDGARPFITTELIETLVKHVIEDKACIVGTPVKETIKVINEEGVITATPNRNTLWAAQTPQAFEYTLIKKAYDLFRGDINKENRGITDDAMVYEIYQKRPVKMIFGDYNNLKLTTPEDLILAEALLKSILCEKDKKKEQFFQESKKTT